jgi:MSHA pilin protein MshC
MRSCRLNRQSGFTLVELVIVLVVLGILSVYAAMRNSNPAAYTLRSQAEKMASDLRHVQALATTWGRGLRVAVAPDGTGYSVSCVTAGTSPCNASPVINPTTGSAFTVTLQQGALLAGPVLSLEIDSLGKPNAAATYTLSAGDAATRNVAVAALTGFVTLP